jgi:hypothetical protein
MLWEFLTIVSALALLLLLWHLGLALSRNILPFYAVTVVLTLGFLLSLMSSGHW